MDKTCKEEFKLRGLVGLRLVERSSQKAEPVDKP